jgi:hypothetical protein
MNKKNFEIRVTGSYLIINRIIFPRIKVYMCRRQLTNEIVRIRLIDKCPASEIVPALNEIDQLVTDLYPLKFNGLELESISI